jgi:outer membrane immunogenic protein
MRKTLFRGVAVITITFGSLFAATAADLPRKAPVTKALPPPMASWTGFYFGFNAGYAWEDPTVTFTGNDLLMTALLNGTRFAGGTPAGPASFKIKGPTGGIQAGYNWQVNQTWVVGVETDFNFSNITGNGVSSSTVINPPLAQQTITADQKIAWYGTLRARVGALATPDTLLYGTAGFAYGRIRENVSYSFSGGTLNVSDSNSAGTFQINCPVANPNDCVVGSSTRIGTGWTAGAGAEHRVSTNVSLKAEYLYVNLGSGDAFNAVGQGALVAGRLPVSFLANYSSPVDFHTVRVGLNVRY